MKYLSTIGNQLTIRIILSIFLSAGIYVLFSGLTKLEYTEIIFGLGTIYLTHIFSKFHSIKYNSKNVYISNYKENFIFAKASILKVVPLKNYLNLYYLELNNGDKYLFGINSSKFLFTQEAIENAKELETEILK